MLAEYSNLPYSTSIHFFIDKLRLCEANDLFIEVNGSTKTLWGQWICQYFARMKKCATITRVAKQPY